MTKTTISNNTNQIFYSSAHENGVLLFVLGVVFVLKIYHFLLYFQHKNPTYIYYATYTLLLFIAYFTFTKNDFLDELTSPFKDFFSLGVGFKQKEVLLERNDTKNKLIQKLQENEDLKEKVNLQLQEKVNVLSDQINLKEELEELKSTAFRSQMNPHFIFNALNSIKLYIINNEPKIAAHYLNKFSKLIRRILEASNQKESSLFEELETMNLYMTIENIRFYDEINFKIIVDENINLKTIKVPPLVLQPFLEDALWQGLSSKKK